MQLKPRWFMLVACCTFVTYVEVKLTNIAQLLP
jgi:hypothetical protein